MDTYDDSNYTPSLEKVRDDTEAMRTDFRLYVTEKFSACVMGDGADINDWSAPVAEVLERHSKGEINKLDAIQELAHFFSFMDGNAFWSGGPMQEHWHSSQIESALYHIDRLQCEIIDKIWNQCQNTIKYKEGESKTQPSSRSAEIPSLDEFNKYVENQIRTAKEISNIKDQLIEYALKVGFLYRDNWWLESHGEAAAEYYKRVDGLKAQESGRKAGGRKTQDKAMARRQMCKVLIGTAVQEKGLAFVCGSIKIQAETIQEIAIRDFKSEFEFKPGKLLALKWFRERIEDFSSSGELVQITEGALNKA